MVACNVNAQNSEPNLLPMFNLSVIIGKVIILRQFVLPCLLEHAKNKAYVPPPGRDSKMAIVCA